MHVRAAVTLFDELLQRVLSDRLANHWPNRVLPIGTDPPRDVQTLIDEEFTQIKKLLAPGNRKRPDARARIRSLLALEAHVSEGVVVSKRDVDRIEFAIKKGGKRNRVFPRLRRIGTEVAGAGANVTVKFSKTEAMPVKLVKADSDIEAAAVREVDLQRKYHWSKPQLAEKLGLTQPRSLALRHYLGIEEDDDCRHDFEFGRSVHRRYSDNAYTRMKKAIDEGVDLDDVWNQCRPGGPGRSEP